MGRPRADISQWNPGLTLPENAEILGVKIAKAYYLSMRYHLKFKARARGTKPGHVFGQRKKSIISSIIASFSGDVSCAFGMGEGPD